MAAKTPLAKELEKARRKAQAEALAMTWEQQLMAYEVPPYVKEHRFNPPRLWRFDYAWPDLRLAVEIEGGVWVSGRHTRGVGFRNDCIKYATASLLGWTVMRFTSDMVEDGTAIGFLDKLLLALPTLAPKEKADAYPG